MFRTLKKKKEVIFEGRVLGLGGGVGVKTAMIQMILGVSKESKYVK